MIPTLLYLCKVEIEQEHEVELRAFKFKKIVKSNPPELELLAANRT